MDSGSQRGPGQGTCGRDLGRVIFYVSVPVQLYHLSRLIPYRVGVVTCCSEGCAVIQSGLAGMSEMVLGDTTETVVSHWWTWCVWWDRGHLENREKQKG